MSYLILDEETQIHKRFKRAANPFLKENYIVARGWKVEGDKQCTAEFYDDRKSVKPLHIPDHVTVIVAHNAKFELLYEMRFSTESLHAFFKRGGKIWCTQYAEYLLNAQQQKYHMCTLDSIAEKYGGRVKIDGMKELWEAGVQTSDIDRDLVTDYLIGTEAEGRNSGDIGNTELAYLGQLKEAENLGMLKAIEVRMDGLCATSDMEFRGLKVDMQEAKRALTLRNAEFKAAYSELSQYLTGLPEGLKFNWNSPVHKSAILFGGTVKYEKPDTFIDPKTGQLARKVVTERWPLFDGEPRNPEDEDITLMQGGEMYCTTEGGSQDTYAGGKKRGEPKFKNVKGWGELKTKIQPFFHEFEGYTTPEEEWKSTLTDGMGGPTYSSSSDVMDRVTKRGSDVPFLKALGTVNRLSKEIGTYYFKVDGKGNKKGMLTCVQPWDHMIHHKLNHTSTVTSRLSSSDPNLQNLTRADFDAGTGLYKSEVKKMFVSRFNEEYCKKMGLPVRYNAEGGLIEGQMVEIDYSQLEVVVMGLLSLDENLCRDLNNKVDFHCKRVALKNGITYEQALEWCKDENHPDHAKWKKERTRCKIFSFQRAYGAGAALIAEDTGMALEEVKALIEAEDKEYPGVVRFNKEVEAEVNATAGFFRDKERGYRQFRRGTYQTPTGTMYSFRSYDAQAWQRQRGIVDSFSPTEMKNYPVQGMGGEVVQMVLGQLWRWFVRNDYFGGRAYLVNTVHDCVWADCHPDVRDAVVSGMIRIMTAIPHFLKHFFNMGCPVQFPVDAEVGTDMLELSHWHAPKK